jgi:hypothetical protein
VASAQPRRSRARIELAAESTTWHACFAKRSSTSAAYPFAATISGDAGIPSCLIRVPPWAKAPQSAGEREFPEAAGAYPEMDECRERLDERSSR